MGDVSSFHNTEEQFKVNATTDFSRNVSMFLQGKVQGVTPTYPMLESTARSISVSKCRFAMSVLFMWGIVGIIFE